MDTSTAFNSSWNVINTDISSLLCGLLGCMERVHIVPALEALERAHRSPRKSPRHWYSQPELNAEEPAHGVSELDKTAKSFREKCASALSSTRVVPGRRRRRGPLWAFCCHSWWLQPGPRVLQRYPVRGLKISSWAFPPSNGFRYGTEETAQRPGFELLLPTVHLGQVTGLPRALTAASAEWALLGRLHDTASKASRMVPISRKG